MLSDAKKRDEVRQVLLEIYAANDPMNQLILEHLDRKAWRARLPGIKPGTGRTIAAIFAHLHNCRLVWLKWSAPHIRCPAALDPAKCTIRQASAAHKKSATACLRMLKEVLAETPSPRVPKFSRGSWAPEWPAGATMWAYMFSHEAHHRGQIIMLAKDLGFRLPDNAAYGIWHWEKLWKQLGFEKGPR